MNFFSIETIEQSFLIFAMIFLAITMIFCLVRAFVGPRFTDRILAINVINTKTVILIAVLAMVLGEGYLVDISIVYGVLGFLSVVVLSRLYLNDYLNKKSKSKLKGGEFHDSNH